MAVTLRPQEVGFFAFRRRLDSNEGRSGSRRGGALATELWALSGLGISDPRGVIIKRFPRRGNRRGVLRSPRTRGIALTSDRGERRGGAHAQARTVGCGESRGGGGGPQALTRSTTTATHALRCWSGQRRGGGAGTWLGGCHWARRSGPGAAAAERSAQRRSAASRVGQLVQQKCPQFKLAMPAVPPRSNHWKG